MGTPPSRARRASTLAVLLVGLFHATPVTGVAFSPCEPRALVSTAQWAAPLDRVMTIDAGQRSLRDAIERISAAAGVRLSYSGNVLPADQVVCASFRDAKLGDILTHLLSSAVVPVVASLDHVVLAPVTKTSARQASTDPIALYPVAPVFATADMRAATREPRPGYTVGVIDASQLRQHATTEAAMATVAGVWTWQSPIGFTSQYGTRGATSFGASSPKVYIDGIEVANPLLATQLLPENIERIEVIRGPQGGALYGSDAVNGVTNIITRHRTVDDGAPRLHIRSGLAVSTSAFVEQAGVGQDHLVSLHLGSRANSGALNMGISHVGEFIPGSYSRNVQLDGNMRLIQERTLITGTARFSSKSAANPRGFTSAESVLGEELSMKQYTVGAKLVFRQNERFTHSAVLGVDGYLLNGFDVAMDGPRTVEDSVLNAAGNGALRTTLRVSSAARIGDEAATSALITVAAEHSNLQQYSESRASDGLTAQLDASFLEGASVSGGMRVQRDVVNGITATSALPMLASSYVIGDGALNLRVRSAYGRAIRWPTTPAGAEFGYGRGRVARPIISPEEQTGMEAGVDITIGARAGLQLTRYDQTATGLLQTVVQKEAFQTRYALQSVGEIANDGWEMQVFLHHGAVSLTGSAGLISSRVLRVAEGYTGDLDVGDRMLAVPARTMSLQASWQRAVWSSSVTVTRASDWINYDRRALAEQPSDVTGIELRDYWRRYDGATHLRATIGHTLNESVSLMLAGDNLLNRQTDEPDNATVVPGRTISIGIRAAF